MKKQHTICQPVHLRGRGLHSGTYTEVTLRPAETNHGIKFCRTDIPNKLTIPADVSFVTSTARSTALGIGEYHISTGEHLLATLYALGIDNVLIEVNGCEVPILDGSAKPWVEAILAVGLQKQSEYRNEYRITSPIHYKDEERGVSIDVFPSDKFHIDLTIDYNSEVMGVQTIQMNSLEHFASEYSSARTFVFLHEIETLLQHNLIKGGDLDNAMVFVEKAIESKQLHHLAKIFNKNAEDIKVEKGILNNITHTLPNEPARHKAVDLLGDLALVGCPIIGHVVAQKPGHKANITIAQLIKQQIYGSNENDPRL